MNFLIALLTATTIVLIFILTIFGVGNYILHLLSKNEHRELSYGYANYKTFKSKFDSINWHVYSKHTLSSNQKQPYLLEAKDMITMEQDFIFDNKIMIIRNPIGYLLAVIKIKKYIKDNYRKPIQNKIKW